MRRSPHYSVVRNPIPRDALRDAHGSRRDAIVHRCRDVEREARFLLERLLTFARDLTDEQARDWCGHVLPSAARLKILMDTQGAA